MGERLFCKQEVRGSIPRRSTKVSCFLKEQVVETRYSNLGLAILPT